MFHPSRLTIAGSVAALALLAAGCGGGGGSDNAGGTTATTGGGGVGGTMNLVANAAPSGSADPQINYTLQEWQLLIFTHDGLVAFKRVGGKGGTEIVPDLAESIPTPTDGGKTYKFTLRKGIKFSDGTEVKPSDVLFTFERLFKIKQSPNAATWYNNIVGGDACVAKPTTCDLSKGIVIDDAANTVTFHLVKGNPEFLDQLAVPFAFILPKSTPVKELDIPPAGTGPYKWAEYNPNSQIKLVRNPFFKEWSKDAQPDGKPDVIIQKFGLTTEAEVTAVENGDADWMFDPPPADRLGEISEKYADQVHINPLTAVWYYAMNVRIPPFNNLKARQAVNYAVDRNALVKLNGGPKLAVPTCQILPPNFPGYEPYCPYTKNPGSGKWTAPDMAKAKQLMNESGQKGQPVSVITDTIEADKATGQYFVDLLNELGFKAKLKALSPDLQYPYVQNSKNKPQFSFSSWYQDYPAASDFINILLGCDSFHPNSNASPNISEYCVKSTEDKIQQALKTGITDPDAANKQWAAIDKILVDQAAWVPMFNPKLIDFVSKRVTGYQFSPQWYFLLDQASVVS
jgi:peptide/nickel transport system substrate-binding protein